MSEPLCFEDLPLRERKRARIRLGLVRALVTRLAERSIHEIPVSELAAAVDTSEATFFNHFPSKQHLLIYFLQVWSLDVGVQVQRSRAAGASALGAIEALFDQTAAETEQHPNVMLEILALQARMPTDLQLSPVERGVRLLHLPGIEGVLQLPDEGFTAVVPPLLAEAMASGELPRALPVEQLLVSVGSVFFGVPLLLGRRAPQAIRESYRVQLQLIWAGIRALGEEEP